MSNKRKMLIGVGVLGILAVFVGLALKGGRVKGVEVRTEDVTRHDLTSRVTATGYVEPRTSVDISADVSGRVVELNVEEGDDVEEGDLLLVIDQTRFQAALNRSRAALLDARARETQALSSYEQAQRDWDRIRQLNEAAEHLITATEFEQARTGAAVQEAVWQSAEHGVEIAEASVEEAADQLSKTIIRAPMSGRITRLNVERGETAIVGTMNNAGSLLLTVADLSIMEAVIEVDETDVPEIEIGDSTVVTIDAFPDEEFVGRVTKIGNSSIRPRNSAVGSSSDQAIDFEVRITLADPDNRLRTDLSATADVITAVREDVLAIPIIALSLMDPEDFERVPNENQPEDSVAVEDGEEIEGVFVVEDGIARFRPVEVGIAGDNYFEVLSGLEEEATVISGSYQAIRQLEDGSPVRVSSDSTRGPTS